MIDTEKCQDIPIFFHSEPNVHLHQILNPFGWTLLYLIEKVRSMLSPEVIRTIWKETGAEKIPEPHVTLDSQRIRAFYDMLP